MYIYTYLQRQTECVYIHIQAEKKENNEAYVQEFVLLSLFSSQNI